MSTLLESRKILVVTNPKLNLGEYLSLTVILDALRRRGAKVDMVNSTAIPANLTSVVALGEVTNITKVPARKYILSFDRNDSSIKNIQWQQSDKKLNFHISMEKGDFKPEGLQVITEGADYDTVMYFKINNFAEVQPIFAESGNFVQEVKHISIGGKFSIDHTKVELVEYADAANLAETVYQDLKGQGLNSEQQNRLLASILLLTNRFQSNVSGSKTFTRVAEMLNSGATLDAANSLAGKGSANPTPNASAIGEAKPQTATPISDSKSDATPPRSDTKPQPNSEAKPEAKPENKAETKAEQI